MKRIVFGVLALGVMIATFFVGAATLINVNARPMELQTQGGVNYNYLSSPRLVSACANFVHVVNYNAGVVELLTLGRLDGQTVARTVLTMGLPRHIEYSSGHLFVFLPERFYVFSSIDLATDGALPLNTIVLAYTATNQVMNVFSIRNTGTMQFQVMFGHQNLYGFANFNANTFVITRFPLRSLNFQQTVAGVRSVGNEIFLLASSPQNPQLFFIYRSGSNTPLAPEHRGWSNVSAFNLIGTPENPTFVFIADRSLVLFASNFIYELEPLMSQDFFTQENYIPISLFARSTTEIFVVDQRKQSIDQYQIQNNRLAFVRTVAASRGDDFGFFNFPSSIALIREMEFLVADYSHSVRLVDRNSDELPTTFIDHNRAMTGGIMVYDNGNYVYIYNDKEQRIVRFNLNGEQVGAAFYTFWDGGSNQNFGLITQLVSNHVTQEIFALDTTLNNIYILRGTRFEVLPTTFYIAWNTRAVISAERDVMYLINTGVGSNVHLSLCLDTHVTTLLTTALAFGAGYELRDITIDVQENLIILAQNIISRDVYFNHVLIEDPVVGPRTFTKAFGTHQLIDGASVRMNPSLQLCKLNNKIFWIGRTHSIEAASLRSDNIWTFRYDWTASGFEQHEGYDWQEIRPIPVEYIPLFGRVAGNPFLYEFPSSVNPLMRLNNNTVVRILSHDTEYDSVQFDYLLVMFENLQTRVLTVGYINSRFIMFDVVYCSDDIFRESDHENLLGNGRVILNNVPIFKYPSSVRPVFDLRLSSISKNFNYTPVVFPGRAPGLHIERRITHRDANGWEFFQIRVDHEGRPHPDGLFLGFVYVGHVININEPPSNTQNLNPNARVVLPTDYNPRRIPVFTDANGVHAIDGEYLEHHQLVRVQGRIDRSREFTFITYLDEETGVLRRAYVRTRYLVPDGLSTWQLLGIILVIVGSLGATLFLIKHYRNKKRQT
ncbi:MAG: hypothetical protein FWE16_01120 [Firmicutes bacterium]|nr:hypothetical protein [Bacillota bacterium]